MQIASLIGRKIDQTQGFLEDGTRVPLTIVSVAGNTVSQIKTMEHEGYNSVQLAYGTSRKRPNKPMSGHIKKAGLETTPRFFREVRVDEVPDLSSGTKLEIAEVFEPGDIVDVTGTSKGKGFAGVVKRYRFHGGPRTHGQSDRERARGSSGSGTTPGRVYKGKKMAGRMGNEQVTVKNLEVLSIKGDNILVRGLVPGSKGSIVVVKKVGRKNKNFMPLWSASAEGSGEPQSEKKEEEKVEMVVEEIQAVEASSTVEEQAKVQANEKVEEAVVPENTGEPRAASAESFSEPKEENA